MLCIITLDRQNLDFIMSPKPKIKAENPVQPTVTTSIKRPRNDGKLAFIQFIGIDTCFSSINFLFFKHFQTNYRGTPIIRLESLH